MALLNRAEDTGDYFFVLRCARRLSVRRPLREGHRDKMDYAGEAAAPTGLILINAAVVYKWLQMGCQQRARTAEFPNSKITDSFETYSSHQRTTCARRRSRMDRDPAGWRVHRRCLCRSSAR